VNLGFSVDDSHGKYTVLSVAGEIDISTAPSLRMHLHDLIEQAKLRLIVDLEAVDFLDSTGLGVLVSALKRVRGDQGDLVLVCTRPQILKVFDITGLSRVFAIHETLDAALNG
jgi:anti-sigma B factor antagonist